MKRQLDIKACHVERTNALVFAARWCGISVRNGPDAAFSRLLTLV